MKALLFLAAHLLVATALVLIGQAIVHSIERPPLPVLIKSSGRERGGTIVCQPIVGPKLGTRPTPREIV